jgi:hypothetical protein
MKRKKFLASLLALPAIGSILPRLSASAPILSKKAGFGFVGQQTALFDAKEPFILAWGPHGGGKTYTTLHKLVHHCWANENALAVMIAPSYMMADRGGEWNLLRETVLPEWRESMRLEWSEVKKDATHQRYFHIKNTGGKWSQVRLIVLQDRKSCDDSFRGMAPSFVMAANLDSYKHPAQFLATLAQLGRRSGVVCQQFIGEARPSCGVGNWIYKRWFVDRDESHFRQIHIPPREVDNEYTRRLAMLYPNVDPVIWN